MWLIGWLLDRFWKLIYLLDQWFWSIYEFVARGVGWFLDRIAEARNWLYWQIIYWRDWLLGILWNVRDWLNGQIIYWRDWLWGQIQSARDWLFGQIIAWRDWLWGQIQSARDWLFGQIIAWRDWLWGQIQSARDWLFGEILRARDYALGQIAQAKAEVLTLLSAGLAQIAREIAEARAALTLFKQTWEVNLTGFFGNPAAVIFGYLEAYLMPWAEWFFALALLGERQAPPPRPALFGAGGPLPIFTVPPISVQQTPFAWPTQARQISGFGFSPLHPGIDIGAGWNAPVWAAAAGRVVRVGYDPDGYGNFVILYHTDGWTTLYGHLTAALVGPGQGVYQGGLIGLAGSTGNSTGPHLHFEIRQNNVPVNPLNLLP